MDKVSDEREGKDRMNRNSREYFEVASVAIVVKEII